MRCLVLPMITSTIVILYMEYQLRHLARRHWEVSCGGQAAKDRLPVDAPKRFLFNVNLGTRPPTKWAKTHLD